MAASQSPKLFVGVRVPGGTPIQVLDTQTIKRGGSQVEALHLIMEVWQSPVYCNSLENCRSEMVREFESHRFRQVL